MYASICTPYQFVTLRTYGRAPHLASDKAKRLLLAQMLETRKRFSLNMAGYAILEDHLHLLFNIATGDVNVAMNDLRGGFLRAWRQGEERENQPFWERSLELRPAYSTEELRGYLDFIHYDPVRHGLVQRPSDYPWSSLPARVEQGHYPEQWGVIAPPACIVRVERGCSMAHGTA